MQHTCARLSQYPTTCPLVLLSTLVRSCIGAQILRRPICHQSAPICHYLAGAPEGHSVPLFNSTSYVSLFQECISNVGHIGVQMSNISEVGQRIQCEGLETERACPQTAQTSTLPHHHISVQKLSTKYMEVSSVHHPRSKVMRW